MKTELLQIRITPELKSKLKTMANEENRTITNFIENLIKQEIKRKERNI